LPEQVRGWPLLGMTDHVADLERPRREHGPDRLALPAWERAATR
jgi:hypothetical protein